MYDCFIIGSGPAGVSAALNLQIHKMNFLWFGSSSLSDKVLKAEKILNYPGIPSVSGADFKEKLSAQIQDAGITIKEKTVTNIMDAGSHYMVLADNEIYETKTLILAMGVMSTKVLENEEAFLGRGVSYCATCDGMFYKGKKIAVLCTSPKYEHEVEFLADLASEVIYFPSYKNPEITASNVVFSTEKIIRVEGEMKIQRIVLKNGESMEVDGLFCLRDAIAPTTLMPGLLVEEGAIVVDRSMQTNFRGVFAAGDCTGRPYQYTKAVGEGNVAAHSVIAFLAKKE